MIVLLEMKRNTIPSKHLFEIILKAGNPILKNKSISLLIHNIRNNYKKKFRKIPELPVFTVISLVFYNFIKQVCYYVLHCKYATIYFNTKGRNHPNFKTNHPFCLKIWLIFVFKVIKVKN